MEKYRIGEHLLVTNGHYKDKIVKVVEIGKKFKETDEQQNFVYDGLVTFESDIKFIKLPYTFDGQTLVVEFPEEDFGGFKREAYKRTSAFYGYYYDVRVVKPEPLTHLARISESQLTHLQFEINNN